MGRGEGEASLRRARLLAREAGVREHAALLEHAAPVAGAVRRRALHAHERGVQRAAHGVQARRHRRQLEAPRRAPLGLAEDGGDQRGAVLWRRRVREPDRAPQLLPQPLGDGRVLAAAHGEVGGGLGAGWSGVAWSGRHTCARLHAARASASVPRVRAPRPVGRRRAGAVPCEAGAVLGRRRRARGGSRAGAAGQGRAREGDEARALGVEPHVLGVALHRDHLDAWHGARAWRVHGTPRHGMCMAPHGMCMVPHTPIW